MTNTNRARGRPEISVQRICEACANRTVRRDGRDQLCLICATLAHPQTETRPSPRRSRKDTR